MSETPDAPSAQPDVSAPPGLDAGAPVEKKKKKKDKVRTAWISFVGRIVAQILGAVASVVLGVLVLRNYTSRDEAPAAAATPPAPARVAPARAPGEVALVVLPLDNYSGDPSQSYFADGMTDALIADLAQIEGLRVISRTSAMSMRGKQKSVPEISEELGVDLIVEGSVVRSGDRVRVTAQLIDAKRDVHLWARNYDRTMHDVLTLQGEVALAIAREVKGALTPVQLARFSARQPLDPALYDLYLRGRHAWNQRTPAGFQDAIGYFEHAIRKDPQFALAHAGLADAYGLVGSAVPDAMTKARASAERALAIDDSLAEAHASLAAVLQRHEGRIEEAEREFRRALELNPGYTTAHQWYAILLAELGRDGDAMRHAERAVALDPLSGTMHQALGLVHYYGRRYDRAVAEERRALELAPQLPLAPAFLARALLAQGDPRAAIAVVEDRSSTGPDMLAILGPAYLKAGDRTRAEAVRQKLLARTPLPALALAQWHTAAGQRTEALDMLERAVTESQARPLLMADPVFDGLRADARFAELLRRAKRL